MSNSVTILIPRRDKERLERLAKKKGFKKLSDAFRYALSAAERETDTFHGDIASLIKAQTFARSAGAMFQKMLMSSWLSV